MSKSLALYAFEVLVAELKHRRPLPLDEFENVTSSKTASYPAEAPLFVTWNKNGDLRGCIGTFSAMPTEPGVARFALVSALEDTRFSPVQLSEVPALSASITLLDNFTPIKNPRDWEVGSHGLKVSFSCRGRSYSGTFLPSVAEEQGWGRDETLWNLLRKAGLGSVPAPQTLGFYEDALAQGTMKLVRYEGLKCSADYAEYEKARERE